MRSKEEVLPRITFEGVLRHKYALLAKIRKLISENRTLREEEGEDFYTNYDRATLGFGVFTTMELWGIGERSGAEVKSITVDDVVQNHLSSSSKEEEIQLRDEPTEVWRQVRGVLNKKIFGQALQEALRLSPERDRGKVYAGIQPVE